MTDTYKIKLDRDSSNAIIKNYGSIENGIEHLIKLAKQQKGLREVVKLFESKRLERTKNDLDKILLGDLYLDFQDFCNEENIKTDYTKISFKTTMEDLGFIYGIGNCNMRCFKAVKFKTEEQDIDDFLEQE